MRHATEEDLDRLDALLERIRAIAGLTEKKRGVFYWKSKAFLHFHDHDGVPYADVRLGDGDFDRFPIAGALQQSRLVTAIRRRLAEAAKARG